MKIELIIMAVFLIACCLLLQSDHRPTRVAKFVLLFIAGAFTGMAILEWAIRS